MRKTELTELLETNMTKIFFKYLIPSVGGMLGVSLYVLGDTMIVGRGIGSTGLAALNISIPMINVFHGLGLLFGMGASTAISISRGKGDEKQVNNIFSIAILVSLLIGLCITLVRVFFLDELSLFLGASKNTFEMSTGYLGILMTFSPLFILNYALNVLVRNDGNPNLSMWAMLTGTIVNVILDYIFIFIFKWGMKGAALATCMSPLLSLFIQSFHFIMGKNKMRLVRIKAKFKVLKRIVANGFASFVIEFSSGIVIFIFNKVILGITGDIGVSAYSIIANLSLIATAIFTGVGQSIQPIISVNFGAEKMDRVYKAGKFAIYTSTIIGIIFYLSGLLVPEFLVSIFSKGNEQLLNLTIKGIRIYFIAFIFMGINIVLTSYLQSKEYARASMIVSLLRGFILIVIFLLILSNIFGITGVWMTLPLVEFTTIIIAIIVFKHSRKLFNIVFT